MTNATTRPCPICVHDEALAVYRNTMATLDGLDLSYRVARCARCGFCFADRLPHPLTYAAYYESLSKYDIEQGASSAAEQIRCDAAVGLLRPHVRLDGRIADLGCGSGRLLGAFRDAGWSRLSGIDPAPRAADRCLQRTGLDCIRSGTIDQAGALLDLPGTDAICLTGVLEHLPRLREDLEALTAAIRPGTLVLVEVPALERFAEWPCEPYGEFSLEHIQYFSASSLGMFFGSLGFATLSTQIVELPPGYCDSLFGLFVRDPDAGGLPTSATPDDDIERYTAESEAMLRSALGRIANCPATRLVIYGAGSHTARLLPHLLDAGEVRVAGMVDGNPNLQGKRLGGIRIEEPESLDSYPDATILVSSFRAQEAIRRSLSASRPNRILTLY